MRFLDFLVRFLFLVRGRSSIPGNRFVMDLWSIVFGQQVSGDLLADELVVGLVLIEGFNHVIAVSVCRRYWIIRIVSRCIRVTHDIQPMTSPFFAISVAAKKSIDNLFES